MPSTERTTTSQGVGRSLHDLDIYTGPGYLESPSRRRAARLQRVTLILSFLFHASFFGYVAAAGLFPVPDPKPPAPEDKTIVFVPPPPMERPEVAKVEEQQPRLVLPTAEPPVERPKPAEEKKEVKVEDPQLSIVDPRHNMPEILAKYHGAIGFGDPNDKDPEGVPFVTFLFDSQDWSRKNLPNGKQSLNLFSAYYEQESYEILDRLRRTYGVPSNFVAYLIFPDEFDHNRDIRIVQCAQGLGEGCTVAAAVIQFSVQDTAGIEVDSIQMAEEAAKRCRK